MPLYNRKENFSRFDLETLFFAFYYQQGSHQQYMAAVELKKQNWKFNKKFVTWFKKADDQAEGGSTGSGTVAPLMSQIAFSAGRYRQRENVSTYYIMP